MKLHLQLSSISVLFGFILFVLMTIKICKRRKPTSNLPPGPRMLPVIGNMHFLFTGSLIHHRLRDLAVKYGPLMHLKLGEVSHMVVSSPELAKEILKTHDLNFCQRPRNISAAIITYDCTDIAFAPYGDYWRQLRKICTLELLSAKRVQSFKQIREDLVSDLLKSISLQAGGGSLINLSKMIFSLTFKSISRVAFGMECEDLEEFVSTMERILVVGAGFNLAEFFPSVKLLHSISGMSSELKRLHQGADKVLQKIMDKHMATDRTNDDEREDIVDVLLNVKEHGNLELPLTFDNIKAVILDLFVAGSDTSSTTIEWAMSELLRDPRAMKKAQEEVRQVFKTIGNVTESGARELEYLKLVIKETLRLHPALPLLIPRECRETCEIDGYEIPAKSKVIVNAWAIGRDPRHWKEPERFWPERFINSPNDYKGTDFKYIPFGSGRRICPGISFGYANVELPLAQLLYHFDWKLPNAINPENFDMTEKFGSTVRRKNDLYLIPVPYRSLTI
ncbi:hypothetical protein ACFE04_029384 [Oxalis oulophora]